MNLIFQYYIVLKKQFRVEFSYKTSFILQYLLIPISIIPWFFISKLIDTNSEFLPENYNYFTFVVLGIACLDFCATIINFIINRVREEQISGVLEEIILTKMNLINYFGALSLYPMLQGLFKLIFYILIMQLFINVNLNISLFLFSFINLFLTVISLAGIGMISASVILLIKRGNYVNRIYILLSSLCSGIAYPVTVLPESIHFISNIIPTTQFVNSIRACFSNEGSIETVFMLASHQSILAVTYIFCGIFILRFAIKTTIKSNALSDY